MKNRSTNKKVKSHTAANLFITLLFVVFITDVVTNVITDAFRLSILPESIVDGFLVILLAYPSLYMLIFRPLSREIAQRKATEKELRRLAAIVESSDDAIIGKTLDGRIVTWNRGAEKIYGYTADEIKGKPISFLAPSERFNEIPKLIDKVRHGESIEHYETIRRRKNGEMIDVSLTISPIRDASGNITGASTISRDITERKAAEELLRRAKEQAELLFRISPSAIFTLDSKMRITEWNDRATEITGYSKEEAIGKVCTMFEAFLCSKECAVHKITDIKPVFGEECPIRTKDGRTLTILKNTGRLKDKNSNTIGIIESFSDITERTRIEKLKDEFISTVSHELRTPLSITKEGISLVLDKIPGPVNEQQAKILTVSKNNVDRLARIINSLLDISRIESGKIEVRKEAFEVISVIRQVLAAFELKTKEKSLTLRADLPKEGIIIHGDMDAITQVLTNLIGNSYKFTGKGFIEVKAKDKGDAVEISVADTGIGIAKENIPKLFNKFQQFGRVTGPGEKGTGLGLAIAKGIVTAHKGRIWAESESGKGTKITFTLPKI